MEKQGVGKVVGLAGERVQPGAGRMVPERRQGALGNCLLGVPEDQETGGLYQLKWL